MAKLEFFNVSGRGWVTIDKNKKCCPKCGCQFEAGVERQATRAEYFGIILPLLQKNPNAHLARVELEIPE